MATPDGKIGDERMKDLGEGVDISTFNQILEMDDSEDDREFSKSIFYGFFDQAEDTFDKMEQALATRDLCLLSELGHFIKGSSLTLGLIKLGDLCEKIQRLGKLETEEGVKELDEQLCLDRIRETLTGVRTEFEDVVKLLKHFFGDV